MTSENKGQTIKIGHDPQQISPTKLFETSVAACTLGTFRAILENSKIPYQTASVRSTMFLEEDRPHKIRKVALTITVCGAQATEEKLQRILKMTKNSCTIVQSIMDSIEIEESLEIKA